VRVKPSTANDVARSSNIGLLTLILSTACSLCTGPNLLAQVGERPLQLSGFGGFGVEHTGIQDSDGTSVHTSERDLFGELGLTGSGYLYDPRFISFSGSAVWDGGDVTVDQAGTHNSGLLYNGTLSFLSDRSFPFGIYFSRARLNTGDTLEPPFTNTYTTYGINGQIRKPWLPSIAYNVGANDSANEVVNGQTFYSKSRFADVTATQRVNGWDMRLSDNYWRLSSDFTSTLDSLNTLSYETAKSFGDRVRLDLSAFRSTYDLKSTDNEGASSTNSDVFLASANLTWKNTSKLDSYYFANYSRNAINSALLLTDVTGAGGLPLAFNPQSVTSSSGTGGAGASYRATSDITLSSSVSYTDNGLSSQDLASLSAAARATVATDSLTTTAGYDYHAHLSRLGFENGVYLIWSHYALASGNGESSMGYNWFSTLSGGDPRLVRASVTYRSSDQANPVFFNLLETHDQHVLVKLDSNHFRAISLSGLGEYGTTSLFANGYHINLDTYNYQLSGTLRTLSLSAARGISNSAEALFGSSSILFQSGGSTGGVPISGALLNPLLLSDINFTRLSAIWRTSRKLQMESHYWRANYVFSFSGPTNNRTRQFDVDAQYQFGRFTLIGGYVKADSSAFDFTNRLGRYFFRVRFPFKIL